MGEKLLLVRKSLLSALGEARVAFVITDRIAISIPTNVIVSSASASHNSKLN